MVIEFSAEVANSGMLCATPVPSASATLVWLGLSAVMELVARLQKLGDFTCKSRFSTLLEEFLGLITGSTFQQHDSNP